MAGPMAGIELVEMGVWVAGPAAGCALADCGAAVLEIEPTSVGDPARSLCLAPGHPEWQQDPRLVRPRPRTASTPTLFSQRSAVRLGRLANCVPRASCSDRSKVLE